VLQELDANVSGSASRLKQKRPLSNKLVIVSDEEDDCESNDDVYQENGKCYVMLQ